MYLKNIEVHGFKSFAQKINFEFHNGITAIVGPNGSGKSNVGDAVRWVLGEQSAKQLRGGNMQDVIFSGTELRKPLSYASVAITLDNSDHQLPVDYNEVTITRRLYRSGESEYRMNGTSCRLRDINELFYDTGIGKEGYSIIGQGQIDKILSGKPEERRELFDEAAGIVKFKRRKNTTIKKLEEERQNLVRVTDILSELTKQLGPLEKQSETARIYLAKRDTLRELDVNLFLIQNEENAKELKELKEKAGLAEANLKENQDAYEQTRSEYESLEQALSELDEKISALRDQTQEEAVRKQQLEGQIQVMEQQIESGKTTETHHRNRLAAIEEELSKRVQSREKLLEERSALKQSLKQVRKSLEEEEERLRTIVSSLEDCTSAIEDGKKEIIEILNARGNTTGKAQRFDAMMEQFGIRQAEINQKLLTLKTDEKNLSDEREREQHNYDEISQEIKRIEEENRKLEEEFKKLSDQLREQNGRLQERQSAYHRSASRLESLRNLTERYDGYGNSIRRVMEQKERVPGIHGVVADLLHVKKDYEIAIETALGGSIQNIVTDNEQTAKQMIEFLKKNRFGRATFLPLNSLSTRGGFTQERALSEPGVIGLASSLVDVEPQYRILADYLLGRVLVVDHIDHAIAIARKYKYSIRMVTVEGESLSPGGSMTGGAFKNNSNLLGRRREIEELEKQVAQVQKNLDELNASIEACRSSRSKMREQASYNQEMLQRRYLEQNTAGMNLAQLAVREKEIQSGYDGIRGEREELKRQMDETRSDHSRIEQELMESRQDEQELERFLAVRQKELDEWKQEEAHKSKELEGIRLNEAALAQKESFEEENLNRIQTEMDAYEKEKTEIGELLETIRLEQAEKQEGIVALREAIQSFTEQEARSREQMETWRTERETKSAQHRTIFTKRDELSGQISLLDKECFRLNSQIEKIEENRESRISYMWEEYEITPNNALQYKREEYDNVQQLKQEINQVKEEIRRLGNVNVNAIEDYKELLERHTFLSGQYEDLVEAEKTLVNVIEELDEGMRKQFAEKFRDIQREFDKAFKELFGGGKGTLELDEDADILEAGVRIISQPPGKKLQNMMQLSGGEKALTAIALLFAIQNLKPSPFCLLDEIEAALDDSNVGRFAGYLQKLTKNTQFIIITHRRGTMNAADRLYGITMQEKGVSTLVSVDLVENQLTK
jgi:chromosome segregation protein